MDDSLQDALAGYQARGFDALFAVDVGAVLHCLACDARVPAADVHMQAMHRFEGASDPSEESVAVALVCSACDAKGTVSLSYGPAASAEDAAVLVALDDHRAESSMQQGL